MKRSYVLAPLVALLANSAGAGQAPASITPTFPPQSSAEFLQNSSLDLIGLPRAMAAGITGQGAVIAVIDDGYDLAHPAFRDRVIEAVHTATAGLDPMPTEVHGTHVSGIASGIAPGADLALYTYTEPDEPLDLRTAANAFYAGAAQNATVYSNSWGIDVEVYEALADPDFFTEQTREFVEALRAAQQTGVIVFAASNDPELADIDVSAALPLVFPDLQEAWLAVVNLAPDGSVISVNCGSAAEFCLAAPGTEILSSVPGGGYEAFTGTSMATPHVSGAVSLAAEIFPEATPEQRARLILQTATDLGEPGVDPVYGWGMLNIGNIVDTVEPATAAVFANAAWSRFATMRHVRSTMRQILSEPQHTDAQPPVHDGLPAAPKDHTTEDSRPARPGIWVAPVYGTARIGTGHTSRGADSDTTGVLLAADLRDETGSRIGIIGGFTQTDLDTHSSADRGQSDAYHLGIYGSARANAWFVQAIGHIAHFDQSITRHDIAGAQGTSRVPVGRSSFDATALAADARAGYTFDLADGSTLRPYASITLLRQRSDGFHEKGAGIFSLVAGSSTYSQYGAGPGLQWNSRAIAAQAWTLQFAADVAYERWSGDLDHPARTTLLGRDIDASTAELGRDVLRTAVQLDLTGRQGTVSGFIRYSGQAQRHAVAHTLAAGLRIRF